MRLSRGHRVTPMRVLVHDYAGHPFQVQLSRELARRGHKVLHLHCGSLKTGKGAVESKADDGERFRVDAVHLSGEFERYSPWRRLLHERAYGIKVAERLRGFRAEIVLSANTPLIAQRILWSASERLGSKFIFWQQDILGLGITRVLGRRHPAIGPLIGNRFLGLERSLLRSSDAIVAISADFLPVLAALGVAADKIHVIENWAPIEELPVRPRDNEWAKAHGLVNKRVVLYSGTLGLKHDPELIVRLAKHFHGEPDIAVVVVSEGIGAEWLSRRRTEQGLANVRMLGYQPYETLPDVFGSADVLLAILEADAGVFSVPSKVLTYLCAGRPLLASIPDENLAARLIQGSGAGLVAEPSDVEGFLAAAGSLLAEEGLRRDFGARARHHAEVNFDIRRITDQFEAVFDQVGGLYTTNLVVGGGGTATR
jgi:colanic acid biosynthesis glycosyl transferase WcaI